MISFSCQIVLIRIEIFKIILNFSLKTWNINHNFSYYGYINRINNRLVFKTKDEYKIEVKMPEIMKIFDSTKKLTVKTKHGLTLQSFTSNNSCFFVNY